VDFFSKSNSFNQLNFLLLGYIDVIIRCLFVRKQKKFTVQGLYCVQLYESGFINVLKAVLKAVLITTFRCMISSELRVLFYQLAHALMRERMLNLAKIRTITYKYLLFGIPIFFQFIYYSKRNIMITKENNKTCHNRNTEKCKIAANISFIDKDSKRKTIDVHLPTTSIYTNIQVRAHKFMADETPEYGGEDQAPDPFDYIVAGMASCTAITIRQYAEKHNIPLKDIDISTQFRIVEPEDNPSPDDTAFRPDQMIKYIKLHGDLTQEQIDELMKISVSPAHKMLEDGVQIFTFNDN
jgi:uncharacterized OsmC-like protein